MERYQKILLAVVAGFLIIAGAIQLYLSFFLDDQLKETAISRFHSATNDAYYLDIENLDLWIWGRQLKASGLTVSQKETEISDLKVTLDELNISGIGFLKLLLNQELDLKQIELINPDIAITAAAKDTSNNKVNLQDFSAQLSKGVLNDLKSLSVPHLWVSGLTLTYDRADASVTPLLSLQNSSIQLHNFTVDSASLKKEQIFPLENITTTFRDIRYKTPDELYELNIDQLYLSSRDEQLSIQSVRLDPTLEKREFSLKKGHEIDRITTMIKQITGEKINFERLNRAEGLAINKIQIDTPDLDIYRDKRAPDPPPNYPPLPQEIIRSIPFPLSIDTLVISNGNIRYSERLEEAEEEGFIEFANLASTFTKVTNIKEIWSEASPTLTAETDVMGKTKLYATFTFPMHSNEQQIKGNLEMMDMQPLNHALEPLAFVRVDDGVINGMDFKMRLGKDHADGQVLLRYKDLKISLLNEDLNKETFGKQVASLFANTFKVKTDNNGEDIRTGKVNFERDEQKSVFNYWWKSLLSGLKSSIGL